MVKIQVYASLLAFALATSSALAIPLGHRSRKGIRVRVPDQPDLNKEILGRKYPLDARDTYDDLEARYIVLKNPANRRRRRVAGINKDKNSIRVLSQRDLDEEYLLDARDTYDELEARSDLPHPLPVAKSPRTGVVCGPGKGVRCII